MGRRASKDADFPRFAAPSSGGEPLSEKMPLAELISANFNLPSELSLQPAYHRCDVIRDQCGVRPD